MADESNKVFDAANFLDNYREDIATPVRKPKKQPVRQPANDAPEPEVETPPPKPKSESAKASLRADAPASDKEADITPDEEAYTNQYLVERVPIGFSKSGWQVAVSREHHDKIVKIIAILGERLTFGGFVDNILRKHFEENNDVIRRLISKNTDF